jgi:hypothetical protein
LILISDQCHSITPLIEPNNMNQGLNNFLLPRLFLVKLALENLDV